MRVNHLGAGGGASFKKKIEESELIPGTFFLENDNLFIHSIDA